MKYDEVSPYQIHRIDALGSFVEVMASALPIDKVCVNFVAYDKTKPESERMTGNIRFYLPVLQAKALADKIMNGAMNRKWKASTDKAKAENKTYPEAVYTVMGGTPADRAKREDGKALSRTLTLAPGSRQPWVLTAECGPGVPGPNGLLIVPDYGYNKPVKKPEQVIRIAMASDKLEEFAQALEAAYHAWVMAKFVPLIQEEMANKRAAWEGKFTAGSHPSSSATMVDEGEEDEDQVAENSETSRSSGRAFVIDD